MFLEQRCLLVEKSQGYDWEFCNILSRSAFSYSIYSRKETQEADNDQS